MKFYTVTVDHTSEEFDNLTNAMEHCEWASQSYGSDSVITLIEEDEDGEEVVVHPTLSFTRLGLRDNQDTFDALFNLYQKGSLDIDIILELLNVDPESTKRKLERDMWTLNDSQFNEVLRGIYGEAGRMIAENSEVIEKIAENLGLEYVAPAEDDGGRF